MGTTLMWELVASFIGGGVGAAFITWVASYYLARQNAKRDYLDKCIHELYAPVVRLLRDSAMRMSLCDDVRNAETKEFHGQRFADVARQRVDEEQHEMIAYQNDYAAVAIANMDAIVRIASDFWHLCDSDDIRIFDEIRTNAARHRVEYNRDDSNEVSGTVRLIMHEECGPVGFFEPGWLEHLQRSYNAKLAEYRRLIGVRSFGDLPMMAARQRLKSVFASLNEQRAVCVIALLMLTFLSGMVFDRWVGGLSSQDHVAEQTVDGFAFDSHSSSSPISPQRWLELSGNRQADGTPFPDDMVYWALALADQTIVTAPMSEVEELMIGLALLADDRAETIYGMPVSVQDVAISVIAVHRMDDALQSEFRPIAICREMLRLYAAAGPESYGFPLDLAKAAVAKLRSGDQ